MRKPLVPSQLGNLKFECVIRRESSYYSVVPRYPVEDGTTVSDSILKHPMTMTLEIMVTDHPLTWSGFIAGSNYRVADVRQELLQMYYSGNLYTLTTPDNVYENMAITNIRIPDDRYINAMDITITLQQVNITSADTVIASTYRYSGLTWSDFGTADTVDVSDANISTVISSMFSGMS